jgi:Zn-dependent membrane protease YugP
MIWIIFIVFAIASFAVSNTLKRKFKKYSQIPLASGMSGKEVAEKMLRDNGIYDVSVVHIGGSLTDHYNPSTKTVNLSEAVFMGRSAASAAIAAHECGHAVQHATAYNMLTLRTTLVPLQNASGKIMNIIFFGMLFGGMFLTNVFPMQLVLLIVIGVNFVFTLFAFVTLPVEFDASKRALQWIEANNVVTSEEYAMSKDALKWAAMTYVVAALGALTTLLYYVMIFLGGRD